MSVYRNPYARERARKAAIAAKETRRRVGPLLDNLSPPCRSLSPAELDRGTRHACPLPLDHRSLHKAVVRGIVLWWR